MVIQIGTEPDPAKRIRQKQGKLIRKYRTLQGLSITEFAELVGVTEGAVSQWETGRYSPRPAIQVRIAKALNAPWSALFALDGEAA